MAVKRFNTRRAAAAAYRSCCHGDVRHFLRLQPQRLSSRSAALLRAVLAGARACEESASRSAWAAVRTHTPTRPPLSSGRRTDFHAHTRTSVQNAGLVILNSLFEGQTLSKIKRAENTKLTRCVKSRRRRRQQREVQNLSFCSRLKASLLPSLLAPNKPETLQ